MSTVERIRELYRVYREQNRLEYFHSEQKKIASARLVELSHAIGRALPNGTAAVVVGDKIFRRNGSTFEVIGITQEPKP